MKKFWILLILCTLFLPGCRIFNWFSSKNKGEAVVTLDGRPEIFFDEVKESYEQFKNMFSLSGENDRLDNFLDNLIFSKILKHWANDSGLKKKGEFQKRVKEACEYVESQIVHREFFDHVKNEIPKFDYEQLKRYYADNKKKYLKSKGGVNVQIFPAGDQEDAFRILDKLENGKVPEGAYELFINVDSNVDKNIKNFALTTIKVPAKKIVRGVAREYFVVELINKKSPEYQSFDEVRDVIQAILEQKAFSTLIEKKIAELKNEYKVEIKRELLNKILEKS